NRHAWFHLEHLQEHLFKAHIGAPVHSPKVISLMKIPVIQKLLSGTGETGSIVTTHKAGEGCRPAKRQPFQPFQKSPVDERRRCHVADDSSLQNYFAATAPTVEMISDRTVSGVCPSAWASKLRIMRCRKILGATSTRSATES